jgi:hypothetical protein
MHPLLGAVLIHGAIMKKVPIWFDNKVVAYALVDDEDYALVNQYDWYADAGNYAILHGNFTTMHELIYGRAPRGYVIDHINGRGIDNRRSNLRLATRSQNSQNHEGSSKYGRGITFRPDGKRSRPWGGVVCIHDVKYFTKPCATREEAMLERDKLVRQHHGEFGRYHFPRKGERGMDGQVR